MQSGKIVLVQLQLFSAVPWDVGAESLSFHFNQPTGAAPFLAPAPARLWKEERGGDGCEHPVWIWLQS